MSRNLKTTLKIKIFEKFLHFAIWKLCYNCLKISVLKKVADCSSSIAYNLRLLDLQPWKNLDGYLIINCEGKYIEKLSKSFHYWEKLASVEKISNTLHESRNEMLTMLMRVHFKWFLKVMNEKIQILRLLVKWKMWVGLI